MISLGPAVREFLRLLIRCHLVPYVSSNVRWVWGGGYAYGNPRARGFKVIVAFCSPSEGGSHQAQLHSAGPTPVGVRVGSGRNCYLAGVLASGVAFGASGAEGAGLDAVLAASSSRAALYICSLSALAVALSSAREGT